MSGYLVYHPKREISAFGKISVYHANNRVHQDPYVWNSQFLHTYCHMTQMKPPRDQKRDKGKGTFDFLGFTHYWTTSRSGNWVIKRKTARKRLHRTLTRAWNWYRQHRHKLLKQQYRMLCLKLQGHYQYYGIRGNMRMMKKLYWYAVNAWWYWLNRRSHKGKITWEKFELFQRIYPLPPPMITHAIYSLRGSKVLSPVVWKPLVSRWRTENRKPLATDEPDERIVHVRFCGGSGG